MSGEELHTAYDDKEKFSLHPNNLPMHKATTDNLVLRNKLKSIKTKGSDVRAHFEKSDFQMRTNPSELHFLEFSELNCC